MKTHIDLSTIRRGDVLAYEYDGEWTVSDLPAKDVKTWSLYQLVDGEHITDEWDAEVIISELTAHYRDGVKLWPIAEPEPKPVPEPKPYIVLDIVPDGERIMCRDGGAYHRPEPATVVMRGEVAYRLAGFLFADDDPDEAAPHWCATRGNEFAPFVKFEREAEQ